MAINRASFGSRRQQALLAGLLVALAVVFVFNWRSGDGTTADPQQRASNAQGRPQGRAASRTPADELDVKLEALQTGRERPGEIERNPFRMEAPRTQAPPVPGGDSRPRPPVAVAPPTPSGPPPIPLKFTGIIESKTAGRIAALTDCKNVFQGREGDIIEGRYRIVRIGVESIVLEYVDGGPEQTIRLSGCG